MKPLHVGLLVIGAALAGGLAVKMSQPPTFRPGTPVAAGPVKSPPRAPISAEPAGASPAAPAAGTVAPPAVYEDAAPVREGRFRRAEPKAVVVRAEMRPAAPKSTPAVQTTAPVAEARLPAASPAPPPVAAPVPYEPPRTNEPAVSAPPAATVPEAAPPPVNEPAPAAPAPLQVTLHQGTQLAVRLDQALSSDHLFAGDSFQGSLAEPLVADGFIVGERGARVSGRVVASKNAGRLNGTAELQLALASFQTADGQKIAVSTEPWSKQGSSGHGEDVAKIGGGAALGAIIGAIAGGGKGAAIGAGVGGAAGTGAAAATRGKAVSIPSETVIRFRLASTLKITERQL